MKDHYNKYKYYYAFIGIVGASIFVVVFSSNLFAVSYDATSTFEEDHVKEYPVVAIASTTVPQVTHVETPESVKAIYMTSCVVGTPSFRQDLVDLIEETELNSVIIDIKDFTGTLSFRTDNPLLKPASDNARCLAPDMKDFIESLHEKDIYVIGRITVFQDPFYTKMRPDLAVKKDSDKTEVWKDYKGLSFLDVGSKEAWDYTIEIAKESYELGFDELNFDYIRFPSDGNMKDIHFSHSLDKPKSEALEEFFEYLQKEVKSFADEGEFEPVTSADLFGMVTTNTDDLNIGQQLEKALPYFDYIAPMVYPSHYPATFNGYANPNEHPYELIRFVMTEGVKRTVATTTRVSSKVSQRVGTSTPAVYTKPAYDAQKLRPWIQDFDYGGNYGPKEVRAQIQGAYDAGLDSWMLWAPSNRYTHEALLPAKAVEAR